MSSIIMSVVCLSICAGVWILRSPGTPLPLRNEQGNKFPSGISEKIFVTIGGIKQGMFIRGRDFDKPVLLFLHGGPGMPTYFLAGKYPTGLEEKFIVCYWEQRGGGLSYHPGTVAREVTVDRIVSDAIEVADYLRRRFKKEKIYLMGHSWGSFVGIQAAARAPKLFNAYIGVAQIADQAESEKAAFAYMLEKYTTAGDTAMVKRFANYRVDTSDSLIIPYFRSALRDKAMHKLGIGTMRNMKSVITGIFLPIMVCQAYTVREKFTLWRAKFFILFKSALVGELLSTDLACRVPRLEIPAYFLSGLHDYTVNYGLSKNYLSHLRSPQKGFYTFENSAHCPMHEEPQRFMKIMSEDVLKGTVFLADR